jgi:hypothetical protein
MGNAYPRSWKKYEVRVVLIFTLSFISFSNYAQKESAKSKIVDAPYDTAYFASYPKMLTTRFYFSQKYTALTARNSSENYALRYRPNTTLNMGVGATYKYFSLNLAYGWPFLNHEDEKGKTHYLDLQFHGYTPKFNLDVLAQFYRGFYFSPKGAGTSGSYYHRPDLAIDAIGASYQYVFNHRRFSFRASALQSEWQKKSAGTFLLGVEAYGGNVRSDSSLSPSHLTDAPDRDLRTIGFFQFGLNGGYAYTLVISHHIFLTGAATLSADYGFNSVKVDERNIRRYGVAANTLFRICAGYNSPQWAFSIVYVDQGVNPVGPNNGYVFTLNTGNVRANLVYRFHLSRRERRDLDKIIK